MELQTPSNDLVAIYIDKFEHDERYYPADKAIDKLIFCFPENEELEDILLKVTAINRLYSTSVYDVNNMARHIWSKKIDKRLKDGDLYLVDIIAKGHYIKRQKTNKEIYCYSFATKYCNWHNKKSYPIYDSFVDRILVSYNKCSKFSNFVKEELRNYHRFNAIIADFVKHYSIVLNDLKELDKFLWLYGKEKFGEDGD